MPIKQERMIALINSGLALYDWANRARQMIKAAADGKYTAAYVAEQLDGTFPHKADPTMAALFDEQLHFRRYAKANTAAAQRRRGYRYVEKANQAEEIAKPERATRYRGEPTVRPNRTAGVRSNFDLTAELAKAEAESAELEALNNAFLGPIG